MGRAIEFSDSSSRTSPHQEISAPEIQQALAELMTSGPFRSSKQTQELLQYIVDKSLSGHAELLKERMIGIEVFGRRPDYDTNADPVVRARVGEVRKRLALYYQTEPRNDVRISVPQGSFRAIFERVEKEPPPPASMKLDELPVIQKTVESADMESIPKTTSPARPRRNGLRLWCLLLAAFLSIVLIAWQQNLFSPESRAFNSFWSPVLGNSHSVLIYVGGNAVYQLSPAYLDQYYQQHPRSETEEMGFESYIQWPPGTTIDTQDLFPAKDTFVTIGDVAAIAKVEALLVHRNRQFDIRYGDDVTFGDLRESPSILIGAHNNSWTLKMTGNLRYVFSGRNAIKDRSDPQKHWTANASFTEDYAIVSRILNSKTGTRAIAVAGIGYAGTQAAAEFMTNQQTLSALSKTLPAGWERKNIQVVLHTTVTNQLPGTPEVVATYCW